MKNQPRAVAPLHRVRRLRGRSDQRGATTLGFIILACFIGLFAFAVIRLTPVYLNYIKVSGIVDGVHEEFDGQNPTIGAIRTSIGRRFSVESVTVITPRDIKITPDSGGFLVEAVYDHPAAFIGNVSFSVHFDKSVVVRR